jgi:L-iditol 2-dehydrogenase
MKAVFLTGRRQMEVRQVPQPTLERPSDVLLRIDTVGVCGSDMHYYRSGRIGAQVVQYPWIIGHECAGTVVQAGPLVRNLKVGDRVAVDPLDWCGSCDQCATGRRHTCRNQAFLGCPGQTPGSLAEYLVWPAKSCYRIPDTMTAAQATLLEPFSIGLYAQRLAGRPDGKRIGILGAGPIGLCVLLALKAAGPCQTYVTDLLDNRLHLARRFGADWTGDPSRLDVPTEVAKHVPPLLDCVFECAGKQETLDQGVELLKPGGLLLMVGIPEHDRISFDMNHLRRKELTLQNVRRQNECIQPAMDMVSGGKVNLDALATHRFTIDRAQEAFDLVDQYRDGVIKAIVLVSTDS